MHFQTIRRILLLTACFAGAAPGRAQITNLGSQSPCDVSSEAVRVLPGNFTRSVLAPFFSTETDNTLVPVAAATSTCLFVSFDPGFEQLVGSNRTLYQVGPNETFNWAHEGAVYLPDTDEVLVMPDSKAPQQLNRVSLATGAVTPVPLVAPIGVANGGVAYEDRIFVTTFGNESAGIPAGVLQLDVYNGTWQWVLNNWFGLRFNGPNDIVALKDGSIIFTDSEFGSGFTPQGELQEAVYLIPPTGPARVLINTLPPTINGLALSGNGQTLYVSTTAANSSNAADEVSDHSIYAFDLVTTNGGVFASGLRTFAVLDYGFADGFKLDEYGNVFASSASGVDVFSPAGSLLGKIVVPPSQTSQQNVNNLAFAGNKLVLLHNTNVLMLQLNTAGP